MCGKHLFMGFTRLQKSRKEMIKHTAEVHKMNKSGIDLFNESSSILNNLKRLRENC